MNEWFKERPWMIAIVVFAIIGAVGLLVWLWPDIAFMIGLRPYPYR